MKFFNCIGITLFAHFFLIFFFSVSFSSSLKKDLIFKNSLQVNLVALPEKTYFKKQKVEKAIVIKKKKKSNIKLDQKNILKKIKEKLRKQKQKNILKKIKNSNKSNRHKGNKLSSLVQNQIQNYLERLKLHVHSFWSVPQWVNQNNLKVEIIVYLNKEGQVLGQKYFSKSTNKDFNYQAFKALKLASPYPPPPKDLASFLENSGIVFSFP